ncbi:MAG TPA: T9SS type A sorting domain-containing protein [Candidatus Cloacimonadota bacterium]|nr:T9SS type A sorting domain-containing protein [Candidatus Cloacimonadota bacterium]
MKSTSMIIALLIFSVSLLATDVSGVQSGIWTLANSPYNLIGDVSIPSGASLVINAGVTVYAMGNYRINAEGNLFANGTPADSIRFMNGQADPNALWVGIRLENESIPSSITYCYIENASYGVNSVNSPIEIAYCRFNKNQKGMQLYGIGAANPAGMDVHHNLIERSIQNGILIPQNSNAHVHHNELRFNGTGTQYMAAIQLSNQSTGGENNPEINDNFIHHNYKQGITAWDIVGANAIQPHIHHNIIEYNLTGIYLLNASGYVEENVIRSNFISGDTNSGAGVMVAGATSAPYFERNQIYGNFTGFYLGTNAQPVLGDMSIYHAWAQGENQIYDNIDESSTLHSVYTYSYTNSAIVIKAENNFWGSNDPAQINLGINDQLDSPSLPLVDYDPWYWEPEPNTLLTGTIVYDGIQALHNYRIEIVGTVSEQVEHSFEVEYATPFSLAFEIDEPYHVVAKADIVGQIKTLYGSPGGYWLTDTFQPGMTSDTAAFFLEDDLPPIAVVATEPVQEDGRTLFPVYHKLWIYHWDHIDWLYEDGDFRYLKRHTRFHPDGNLEFTLPPNSVYDKFQNLQPGDIWTRTSIYNDQGSIRTSQLRYVELDDGAAIDGSRFPVQLITQINMANVSLMSQNLITGEDRGIVFIYDNNGNVTQMMSYLTNMLDTPLAWGSFINYDDFEYVTSPQFLCYDPVRLQNEGIMELYWQAPASDHQHTWSQYRVYDNGILVATDSYGFPTTSFALATNTDHTIRVAAYDESVESELSPPLYIPAVANDDLVHPPFSLSVYPNPFNASQDLRIKLSGQIDAPGSLKIYNLRGQLLRTVPFSKDNASELSWNGRDDSGRDCATGIYLLRVQIPGRKAISRRIVKL